MKVLGEIMFKYLSLLIACMVISSNASITAGGYVRPIANIHCIQENSDTSEVEILIASCNLDINVENFSIHFLLGGNKIANLRIESEDLSENITAAEYVWSPGPIKSAKVNYSLKFYGTPKEYSEPFLLIYGISYEL